MRRIKSTGFFHLNKEEAQKYIEKVMNRKKEIHEKYEKYSKNFLVIKFNDFNNFLENKNKIPNREAIILGISQLDYLNSAKLLWPHRILFEVNPKNLEYEIINSRGLADILALEGDVEEINLFLDLNNVKSLIYVDEENILKNLDKDPEFIAINEKLKDLLPIYKDSFNSVFGVYADMGKKIRLDDLINFAELRYR